jgi:hypothetical protein
MTNKESPLLTLRNANQKSVNCNAEKTAQLSKEGMTVLRLIKLAK